MASASVRRFTKPVLVFTLGETAESTGSISGYTIRFAAKRALTDPDSLKLFDIAGAITDAANRKFSITLTRNETSIPAGSYAAELRFWKTGGPPAAPDGHESSSYAVEEAVIQVEA